VPAETTFPREPFTLRNHSRPAFAYSGDVLHKRKMLVVADALLSMTGGWVAFSFLSRPLAVANDVPGVLNNDLCVLLLASSLLGAWQPMLANKSILAPPIP
jgi:hypothetical protein